MNFDMYRYEVNHKDKPTSIESSLAIFEGEIATLIRQKFLKDNEIIITRSELEALRIFLSLLSFRSDLRKDQYKNCKFMLKQNHKFVNNLMRKNRQKTLKRTYCNIKSNKSATFCNMNTLTYIAKFVTI